MVIYRQGSRVMFTFNRGGGHLEPAAPALRRSRLHSLLRVSAAHQPGPLPGLLSLPPRGRVPPTPPGRNSSERTPTGSAGSPGPASVASPRLWPPSTQPQTTGPGGGGWMRPGVLPAPWGFTGPTGVRSPLEGGTQSYNSGGRSEKPPRRRWASGRRRQPEDCTEVA